MKRRIIPFLLALALCLTACQTEPPQVSTDPTTVPTQTTAAPVETTVPPATAPVETTLPAETEPLDPFPLGSTGEATGGVLRGQKLGSASGVIFHHIRQINGKLLVVWEGKLEIRSREDGAVLCSKTVKDAIQTGEGCLAVKDNVFAYYNILVEGVVFRDEELNEIKTVPVPQNLSSGNVLISDELAKAYHFAGNTVYETDLETQQTRSCFQTAYNLWELSDLILNGKVLVYWGKDSGGSYFAYTEVETGKDLGKTQEHFGLSGETEKYLICTYQEGGPRYLFEDLSGGGTWELKPLLREEYGHRSGGIFAKQGVYVNLYYNLDKDYNTDVFQMDLYDLHTGKRVSEVLCEGSSATLGAIRHILADTQDPYLWIVAKKGSAFMLYRWAYQESAVEDETVYLQ